VQNKPLHFQVKMDKKVQKATTIIDIAKELNVSKSTVSRALQRHPRIGAETTKAVWDLAKKYNYQPNAIASSLSKQKTDTIGVIVPLLSHRTNAKWRLQRPCSTAK
jgi:DNA-binding LacI/PurR family transcriptional regulator